jgi:hypothetical protein
LPLEVLGPLPVGLGRFPVNFRQPLMLCHIAPAVAGRPLVYLGGTVMA